jgi:hypothetical protein
MKLSQVKTPSDFERYEAGMIAQTYEQLKAEMGMGPGAQRLPDPSRSEVGEDGYYAYRRWVVDHEF